MTIEIKQLIIRARVEAPRPSAPGPAPGPSDEPRARDEQARLVATCVKQVLRALERDRER